MQSGSGAAVNEILIGPIGRSWIKRYAEASHDDNPIHLDPGCVRALGMPGLVVPGSLLESLMIDAAATWYRDFGVRRAAVKFVSPVFEGDTVRIVARLLQAGQSGAVNGPVVRVKLTCRDGKLAAVGEMHLSSNGQGHAG
jgi:acyl dehydratase